MTRLRRGASALVRSSLVRSAVAVVLVAGYGCRAATTLVLLPPMELLIASGDDQYGTTGQLLQTPLHVLVRTLSTQLPRKGVEIAWSVVSGDASISGVTTTVSDSTGSARMSIRLGPSTGEVVVRAMVQEQNAAQVDFHLFTVDRPALTGLSTSTASPGQSITISGSNFSPNTDQDVVRFSGVRGEVTAAASTQLTVTVPDCLPARPVEVTVQLGPVASDPLSLTVGAGGESTALDVGDVVDATDDGGFACYTLPEAGGARYLVMAHSASPVGAAAHPFELTGLAASPTPAAARQPSLVAPSAERERARLERLRSDGDFGRAWDEHLREVEAQLTRGRRASTASGSSGGAQATAAAPARVPAVDDVRTFHVYRNPGDFADVTAIARYVGSTAALFVDVDAPGGGYTQADLKAFSDQFDEWIHPVDTDAFGDESDLDSNDRVIILFTPVVNAQTPRGVSGFVGGFFFGLDLLPESEGSNDGEIFYMLVPDPTGQFSDPHSKASLIDLTPAVLAHEFQHMINFNQRVLLLEAEANEALWLSEALAQYAEELVARAYDDASDADNAEILRHGVRERSRRYLAAPEAVSLLISAGSGSLAERGAGFLYVDYLVDRFGEDLPGRLTRTTRTGVSNVVAQTGTQWEDGLSDWWAATYLDGPGPESGPLTYPTVDLADFLGTPYPLAPSELGGGDFTRTGSLRSASIEYYIVTPETGGSTTLRLGGEGGGGSASQARMRMRIVRIQ